MLKRLLIFAAACYTCFGCTNERAATVETSQVGQVYTTSFPGGGNEESLADALPSVRMISSVGFYRQANFSSPDAWPIDQPITDRIWRVADTVTTFTHSVVGTSTILQFSLNRIALLTSAHVVTFDDTVTTYYRVDDKVVGIRALAVKVRQRNYVAEIPGAKSLEILAKDDRLDIAILGQVIDTRSLTVPVFAVPPGHASDLRWGSFIYVVGYPVGLRMVASGIVSQPMRDADGSFLTDVVFNHGMSGGTVLAARAGGKKLEWVGVVTSGSAETDYLLQPDTETQREDLTSGEPYEGKAYVRRMQRIRYGVTMVVSIDAIRALATKNRTLLRLRGYHLSVLD